ncbi:uncharacterized protein LOC107041886 [Diachasma alloeum]|uniref:uncharacterized protein LOC107041886 n=1 Tax=Diachasma alloeum TaxID=454923 RepID=UPI00073819D3|nr:uncharacterized protein LOC107041886 [Diachasma alloeum]
MAAHNHGTLQIGKTIFTMEIEEQKFLPFLDVLVHRNEDGSLGHRVYRKPTHTDRYLHAFSHHHHSQKNSVISSLMYRALTISQPEYLEAEVQHLDKALNNNGYQSKQVHRILHRLKNKNSAESEPADKVEHQKTAVLPYLQGTTDRISKVLQKHAIRTIFKPPTKIGQMLPSTKDRRPPLSLPGVYKIPCFCGKVYIGEAGKRMSTRIKEYQRCAQNGHVSQFALVEHWMDTGHSIQYDKTEMLASSQGYFARKHREDLEIQKHPNNLNRDRGYQTPSRGQGVYKDFLTTESFSIGAN